MFAGNRRAAVVATLSSAVVLLAGCGLSSKAPASPAVTVSVAASSASTRLGASTQLTATVSNTTNTAVTWQVNGVTGGNATVGTISATGVFTAPLALPATTTDTITAVSAASPSVSGAASEQIWNPLPVISSASAIEVGNTLSYAVDILGSGYVPGTTITANSVVQTTTVVSSTEVKATVAVSAGTGTVAVTVTNPNPGGSTSAATVITLSSQPVIVTVTGSGTTRLGGSTQFTAAVTGTSNTAVRWQVNGIAGGSATIGTISANGLYTAPSVMPSPTSVTITAVSVAQPSVSGMEIENLLNPLPTVTSATATQQNGTTTFALDVKGSGFVSTSVVNVGGAVQSTTFVSATELTATTTVAYNTTSLSISVTNPDPGGSTSNAVLVSIVVGASPTAAARLLDQATFGPTATDIAHVESVGIDAWITEQFNKPADVIPYLNLNGTYTNCNINVKYTCVMTPWWQNVLTSADQLRQRIGFIYSQIFVASMLAGGNAPEAMPQYVNILNADAFANFRQTMTDYTLTSEMGLYLNMLNSAAPVPGSIANENFGRENMQLFTIGLDLLNQDGSLQLDSKNNPIPAYTQDQVQAFAKVFTGWTWASSTGGAPSKFPNATPNYTAPMAAVESAHDTTDSKALLNNVVLPPGQTAEVDLSQALDNIFAHPNVGPFICKQLIQKLVTSTPSPAYVSRISAVFANDGTGTRGNMQAVIRAILEDTEARAGDTNPNYNGGHLREPVLALSGALRGLNFTNTNTIYYTLSPQTANLNEDPLRSSSVFNFFPAEYTIPQSTLTAPEFGIENTATAILRLTLINSVVFNQINGFNVDLSATGTLGTMAASSPANFVNYLSMIFMHSQMPANMQTQIINTITPLTTVERVRVGVYLVLTSSQYKIIQ